MRLYFFIRFTSPLAVSTTFAQDGAIALDAFVKNQMDARHIPGVSVGIAKNETVLVKKRFSLAAR
jgi:hypothetical protein